MAPDSDVDGNQMVEMTVRVPESLLERIDEEWAQRGYSSKPDAIRDALRDWVEPPVRLSEETLGDLEESRKQIERGETIPFKEACERLGIED